MRQNDLTIMGAMVRVKPGLFPELRRWSCQRSRSVKAMPGRSGKWRRTIHPLSC